MKNYKATIAYIGTHYLGWQKTKEGPSIEETLEKVLSQVVNDSVVLQAASRTDQGVHAEGQVVNFLAPEFPKLSYIRALLPNDISLLALEEVAENFHPTLDSQGKLYLYQVCTGNTQLPFHQPYSWHYPNPLDLEEMKQAAQILVGTHDYSAFTNLRTNDSIRTVTSIEIELLPNNRFLFSITGESFLYKMVRNLVGTIVYVGAGRIPLSSVPEILAGKQRAAAGMTAPAHGLTLKRVFY